MPKDNLKMQAVSNLNFPQISSIGSTAVRKGPIFFIFVTIQTVWFFSKIQVIK